MSNQTEQLLVSSPEAARMLAISPRTLWSLAARGELQPVKIGRSVRYAVDDLRRFIEAAKR